jgi:hypothetical protein
MPIETAEIVVPPRFNLALSVIAIGAIATQWLLGVGVAVMIFGAFLVFQTATVRIIFAAEQFEVWQYGKRVIGFPYKEWQKWQVFWPPLPILFYFREIYSPHFIPMLFDHRILRENLKKFIPLEPES